MTGGQEQHQLVKRVWIVSEQLARSTEICRSVVRRGVAIRLSGHCLHLDLSVPLWKFRRIPRFRVFQVTPQREARVLLSLYRLDDQSCYAKFNFPIEDSLAASHSHQALVELGVVLFENVGLVVLQDHGTEG